MTTFLLVLFALALPVGVALLLRRRVLCPLSTTAGFAVGCSWLAVVLAVTR